MKVRELESTVAGILLDRFGHEMRSPGLHASDVWEDLDKQIQSKFGAAAERSPLAVGKLQEFGTVGFLWERVLERTLASIMLESDTEGRYQRPGEQCMDGIYLTPDYIDLDFYGDGKWLHGIEEWKVRWCSYRKADDLEKNFWKMLVQQKSYCRALGTNLSRLRMLFVVGDWRGDITPKVREFELEFTPLELEENWSMILGHARRQGWL